MQPTCGLPRRAGNRDRTLSPRWATLQLLQMLVLVKLPVLVSVVGEPRCPEFTDRCAMKVELEREPVLFSRPDHHDAARQRHRPDKVRRLSRRALLLSGKPASHDSNVRPVPARHVPDRPARLVGDQRHVDLQSGRDVESGYVLQGAIGKPAASHAQDDFLSLLAPGAVDI